MTWLTLNLVQINMLDIEEFWLYPRIKVYLFLSFGAVLKWPTSYFQKVVSSFLEISKVYFWCFHEALKEYYFYHHSKELSRYAQFDRVRFQLTTHQLIKYIFQSHTSQVINKSDYLLLSLVIYFFNFLRKIL